jgi:hypothetical protein
MQISMHDHHQEWSFHLMMTDKQLDKYNAIWFSVPAHNDLTPNNMSYDDVSHWNGKEMKEIRRYLLGVVTQSI